MSRIYEALLRAELDRQIAGGQETETPTEELPTHGNTARDLGNRSLGEPLRTTAQVATAETLKYRHTPDEAIVLTEKPDFRFSANSGDLVAPSAASADLASVRTLKWQPKPASLPALLERGAPVEQFRGLRSRLNEFRDLNKLKTLLISSGLPEEGKSYITANIAISFARHKESRVLLIDGDMRRGTLHKLLGTQAEPGLTEYLAGKATATEVLQRPLLTGEEVSPKGLSSLTFLPCGADAENASDLSGNGRFETLLEQMSPHFDWIIIDSSPVNLVADGANLARVCDGTLLVTRGGVTKYETAQRALTELKASKVLGVVLNAIKQPQFTEGYYGYDGYDKV